MRTLVYLVGCILFSLPVFCQLKNPTIKVGINYPHIPSVTSEQRPSSGTPGATGYTVYTISSDLKETYDPKAGFDLSFNFDAFSHSKFFIRTGLGVQYFAYRRRIKLITNGYDLSVVPGGILRGVSPFDTTRVVSGGVPITSFESHYQGLQWPSTSTPIATPESDPKIGQTTVLYLQVPVMVGRAFLNERLRIQVGAAPSVLLAATQYEQTSTSFLYGRQVTVTKEKSSDGFTNLMVTGLFETSYSITKRIAVNLTCQRAFAPIYDEDNRPGGKATLNSVSLGVSYRPGKILP